MNLDPMESNLLRYAPAGPRPDFGEELLRSVARRASRSRRNRILVSLAGALFLSGVIAQFAAVSTYREAMHIANAGSGPIPRSVMIAYAASMGIRIDDSGAPIKQNGG